jgi:ribosomal protein L20
MKARLYSYVGRKRRKRDFKMLWACRVNAGLKVGTNRQFFQLKPHNRGLAGGKFYQIRNFLGFSTKGFSTFIERPSSWHEHILKGMGAKLFISPRWLQTIDTGDFSYGPPWTDHIMERFARKLWCGFVVKEELAAQVDYVCGFSYGPSSRWRVLLDSISISGFLAGPLLEDIETAYAQGYAWFNRFLTNNRIILNRKMLAQLVLTGELTNLVTTSLLMGLVLEYGPMYGISQRYHPYYRYNGRYPT